MQDSISDKIIQRSFLATLLGEGFYLGTLILKMSFSSCAYLIFAGILLVALAGIIADAVKKRKIVCAIYFQKYPCRTYLFLLLILLQAVWHLKIKTPYIYGDLTGEIMQSFLATDGIYTVNPMTGGEFVLGMPNRLKILSLPAIFASICHVTGLSVPFVCYRLMPVAVLLLSYLAYERVGDFLFGENKKGKITFLFFVAVIYQFGCYGFYTDAARIFLQGFRGESIRAGVLLPYALYCLLCKKKKGLLLAALTEICLVWTLYGCGLVVLMTVVYMLFCKAQAIVRRKAVAKK